MTELALGLAQGFPEPVDQTLIGETRLTRRLWI